MPHIDFHLKRLSPNAFWPGQIYGCIYGAPPAGGKAPRQLDLSPSSTLRGQLQLPLQLQLQCQLPFVSISTIRARPQPHPCQGHHKWANLGSVRWPGTSSSTNTGCPQKYNSIKRSSLLPKNNLLSHMPAGVAHVKIYALVNFALASR